MSNDLAIAAVTAAIGDVVGGAVAVTTPTSVGATTVTRLRPDQLATAPGPGVNLFLYGISPNTGRGPDNLPLRRPDGSIVRPPVVALDLYYLLSVYTATDQLEAHRMLGRAMLALATDAVLTPRLVRAAFDRLKDVDVLAFVTESDLAEQDEPVRVSPHPMSADELTRLWSGFGQAPYVLSVAYVASPVLIEARGDPVDAVAVRRRQLAVSAGRPPQLVALRAPDGSAVARTGAVVTLDGGGLGAGAAEVVVGAAVIAARRVSLTRLAVTLDGSVPAGVHDVRVRLARGGETAALPLAVAPTVSLGAVGDATVTVTVVPSLRPGQAVTVVLVSEEGDPPAVRVVRVPPVAAGADPRPTVELSRADLPPGRWRLRMQVDGVDSAPEAGGGDLPLLVLPPP